ncbi:hypothetical protein V6N13_036642 [Hibiscus sabdariffa]
MYSREEGMSIFIFNLLEKIHWKGLWVLFSYHGDVLDAFIPRKRSKRGLVHLARLDSNNLQGRNKYTWRKKIDEPDNKRAEENSDVLRRVSAVLDSDKRTILNNCRIVRCKKFMHADILANELHEQDISGTSIMNISGSDFLLIFKDHETMENFRKKHEEALGKWFSKVQVWAEDFSVRYRRAWIACHGVPVHAWSEGTFSNIAALWGDIISIDERTLKPTSFYRAYFQILTRVSERINETVELVIGSKVSKVFVGEIEPTFSPNSVWCEEVESSENCMSINSKENQRVNEDVGNFQNDSSGFSDENSRMDSSVEARETTCADVESRDALFGFWVNYTPCHPIMGKVTFGSPNY